MAAKYKETIRKDVKNWKMILIIISFILGINWITYLLKLMENQRLAGYLSIGVFLFMIVLSFKVVDRLITEYQYVLSKGRFITNKFVGRSTKEVLNIDIASIEYIISQEALARNEALKKKLRIKQNFTLVKLDRVKYMVYYRMERGRYGGFLFQPHRKLLEILKNEIGEDRVIQ